MADEFGGIKVSDKFNDWFEDRANECEDAAMEIPQSLYDLYCKTANGKLNAYNAIRIGYEIGKKSVEGSAKYRERIRLERNKREIEEKKRLELERQKREKKNEDNGK